VFFLYNGDESGSQEVRLVEQVQEVLWGMVKRNAARILRLQNRTIAEAFEKIPFELWKATNGFGDQFEVLCLKVPMDRYLEIEQEADTYQSKDLYESIAKALEGGGNRIRFIGLEAILSGSEPASAPRSIHESIPASRELDDRKFSRLAIEEAWKSVPEDGRVHPKVGVVVVKDGVVIASAHRGEIPGCHAEYIALEKKPSESSLAGATVYTTLEPCTARNHPKLPCAVRLADRKVARVVIGMLDPDNRISGRGQRALRKAGIGTDLFPSDLMAEVEDLNRDFVRDRESESSTGEDGLADAILSLARRVKQEQPNAVFLESALSEELKEAPERIARAMDILVSRGRAKHASFVGTWYVYA
jgi:pyrimidine deaminase RibD-like protein